VLVTVVCSDLKSIVISNCRISGLYVCVCVYVFMYVCIFVFMYVYIA
jgi:hypothetical protein